MANLTETETVVKRILPYLERRGYSIIDDLAFETAVKTPGRYTRGYVDIVVSTGKTKVGFLIEAKRITKPLTAKDRDQALNYAKSSTLDALFVVVTNGIDIYCYNSKNGKRILWDSKRSDKIPSKEQLRQVIRILKANPDETVISLTNDQSLPYRPGLPLRQLNALFSKCHNTIRRIEKNEEYAFADFSKLLFLKLLEEKNDIESDFTLPYSYRFHILAGYSINNADQVRDAIMSMIDNIKQKTEYGEVLEDTIRLRHPNSFLSIVKALSSVSFYDCNVDSKGAAFEYYVRATLKGKKLGQYFTPRELVKIVSALVGENKIVNSVQMNTDIKVLDPACGTGGFLVYLMQLSIQKFIEKRDRREITDAVCNGAIDKLKKQVFYGSDANEGVAASAKMNMIIAGDGHTNIRCEDSLRKSALNWEAEKPNCSLILTNPPFGTSEAESLSDGDWGQFPIKSTKGQHLFLQKMIACTISGGEICTVIDEGVLNTESCSSLRKYILETCRIKAVVSLPLETFKPNKINVKSSLLYLEKREIKGDCDDHYIITVAKIYSLGYQGSGDKIRGFDFEALLSEVKTQMLDVSGANSRSGYYWEANDIDSQLVHSDKTYRLDYKYWSSSVRNRIDELTVAGCPTIKSINTIQTMRGKSPSSDSYVDEADGYAVVVKAGNIGKFGHWHLALEGADWIEKSLFDEYMQLSESSGKDALVLNKNDVLLASTGDGTLGKCGVYRSDSPAIPDGHVTVIRVDPEQIDPDYLADYLRFGFGADQIERLYTGSTGLIELTPEQIASIVIDMKNSSFEREQISMKVGEIAQRYEDITNETVELIARAKSIFNT